MAIQANPTELDNVINAIAYRLQKGAGKVKREFNLSFFTFNIEYLPATLNTFTNGSFLVQNDSAFVLTRTTYIATLTDNITPVNAVTVPAPATTISTLGLCAPFLVNIVDSGSGRQFSNVDTHIDNWFGDAKRPFFWPSPQVLDPNSNVTMRIQNLSTTVSYNVRCSFTGYKVFGDVNVFKSIKGI
jgi:hypothetical protein